MLTTPVIVVQQVIRTFWTYRTVKCVLSTCSFWHIYIVYVKNLTRSVVPTSVDVGFRVAMKLQASFAQWFCVQIWSTAELVLCFVRFWVKTVTMSSLWDRTQKLPKEYFKQVEQVYGEHFPLEVRFIYLFCFFSFFVLKNYYTYLTRISPGFVCFGIYFAMTLTI